MRTVFLLRHAKSSWAEAALSDAERPLAPRGERASRRIGKYVRRRKLRPELVLCSTSLRTRQTLEAIAPSLGGKSAVFVEEGLYAASKDELLARLRALPDTAGSVLVIGHNPGLQELALALAARGADLSRLQAKFPTGGLAMLVADCDTWSALGPGTAELVDYVTPRELGDS